MKYQLLHSAISLPGGALYKSDTPVITDEQLEGVDIDRLLDLGAIVELRDDPIHQEASLIGLTRKELDTLAAKMGLNTSKFPSKTAVVEAIERVEIKQEEKPGDQSSTGSE
jgi:hypothetical protein